MLGAAVRDRPLAGARRARSARGRAPAPDPPLVGRERELRRLDEAFERAAQRRAPQLVTVIGEPGIGKSRLARELAARLAAAREVLDGTLPALRARASPTGRSARWCSRRLRGRPLEALTAGCPTGRPRRPRSRGTLGLDESAPGESTPLGIPAALRRCRARRRRSCSPFEDVHWAEPPLLDLVDDLAARLRRRARAAALPRPPRAARPPARRGRGGRRCTCGTAQSPTRAGGCWPPRGRLSESHAHGGRGARPAATRSSSSSWRCTWPSAPGRRRLPPALHALLAARLDLLDAAASGRCSTLARGRGRALPPRRRAGARRRRSARRDGRRSLDALVAARAAAAGAGRHRR